MISREPSEMARKTGHGAAWMVGATIGAKILGVVSQLILAALLAKEDFGVVALCYTTMAFAMVAQQFGVREVLIRSQKRYSTLLGPGLLLAIGSSGIAGVLTIAVAPALAHAWSEPRIIGPLIVLAIEMPLSAAGLVIGARLEIDMRFKAIALIDLWTLSVSALLAISLALVGAGVYSFIVPKVLATLARLVIYWRLTKPVPRLRRVRALMPRFFTASTPIVLGALLIAVAQNGDYAILGAVLPTAQVGIYYFAFVQSTQFAILLNTGLVRVLLPTLSSIRNDESRQVRAMFETVRLLAVPAAGFCVLQATLAGPFLRFFFGNRWIEAIPLLQLLSFAAAPTMACWPWQALVLAQGRYWLKTAIHALSAIGLLTTMAVAISAAEFFQVDMLIAVTLGVALFRLLSGPMALWLACRRGGVTLRSIFRANFWPTIGAVITIALPGFALGVVLPDWTMLLLAPSLLAFYAIWLIFFGRDTALLLLRRLEDVFPHPAFSRLSEWIGSCSRKR